MSTAEERLAVLEQQQENTDKRMDKIEKKVDSMDERVDKIEITTVKIDGNVTAIKNIVEKLDKRDEERKIQAQEDIREFKKKVFYYILGICAAIVIVALGIKKLM